MEQMNIGKKLEELYIDCFRFNDFQPQQIQNFKKESLQLFDQIDNTNIVFQLLINLFKTKMLHLESKMNFNCYNQVLFEIIQQKLVQKPKIFESLFFPNNENIKRIINYIQDAKSEVYLHNKNKISQQFIDVFKDLKEKQVQVNILTSFRIKTDQINVKLRQDLGDSIFAIIDQSVVIVGNFTWNEQNENDQNVIIVENEQLAQQYLENIKSVFKLEDQPQEQKKLKVLKKRIKKYKKSPLKIKTYLTYAFKGIITAGCLALYKNIQLYE